MNDVVLSREQQEKEQLLRQFLAWRLAVRLEPLANQIGKAAKGKNGANLVHDLRVSCRKLRTVVKNFRFLMTEEDYAVISLGLKTLAGSLGTIRELDVFAKEIKKARKNTYAEEAAHGLTVLKDTVKSIAHDKRKTVSAIVDGFAASKSYFVLVEFVAEYHHLDQLTSVCQNPMVSETAQKTLEDLLQKISQNVKALESNQPGEDFHRLRISMKYLRYSMDDFSCFQTDRFEAQLNKMERIQTLMGNIHDRQVWRAQIHEILAVINENVGSKHRDYKSAVIAGKILRRNWKHKIKSDYEDFKKIWWYLQRDQFWFSFLTDIEEKESEQGGDPITSEGENQHLENLPDRAPEEEFGDGHL